MLGLLGWAGGKGSRTRRKRGRPLDDGGTGHLTLYVATHLARLLARSPSSIYMHLYVVKIGLLKMIQVSYTYLSTYCRQGERCLTPPSGPNRGWLYMCECREDTDMGVVDFPRGSR